MLRALSLGNRSPAPSPAPSAAAAAANEPDQQQQDDGTDGGVDDRHEDAGAEADPKLRKQPASDQGADNSDQEIADESEAGAVHDLAGQPTGDQSDEQDDQKTFARHDVRPSAWPEGRAIPARRFACQKALRSPESKEVLEAISDDGAIGRAFV
jgi:hypothetical protein